MLKAIRTLGEADVVAYFAKAGNASHSYAIVAICCAPQLNCRCIIPSPRNCRRAAAAIVTPSPRSYDRAAADIAAHIEAGRTVAVISEGDPLFYGSYMHLHTRLCATLSGRDRRWRHRHVRLLVCCGNADCAGQ